MGETAEQTEHETPAVEAQDLDLIDDALEDEGKDEAELWDELDAAEADAAPEKGASKSEAPESATSNETDDAAEPSGEQSPDTQTPDDPWANATEEQRAAYDAAQAQIKKLEQSDRSQRGRLAAMQRRLNEQSREVRTAPAADDNSAASKDAGPTDDDVTTSDEWKTFETEYPEVAKPMQKLVSTLQSTVTRQNAELARQGKELDAIETDRRQDVLNEQAELLDNEHEDWEEVMAAEELLPWLDKQPRHIQDAALRNAEEIVDAAEAADVVSRFKAFRSAQQDAGNPGANADTPPADKGRGNGNQRLTGKRERQLESATTARSTGPGAAHGIPEDGDPEQIWKALDEQERREAERA